MHLINTILLSLTIAQRSVFALPYEYSYYVSLPGHYQSLQVNDGLVKTGINPVLIQNPQNPEGPDFRRGRDDIDSENTRNNQNDSDIPDEQLDPEFNLGRRRPEFGTRVQPRQPEGARRQNSTSVNSDPNREREEVTTEEPCTFCGVNRVNPMDSIDGKVNPDSEPVEPKHIGGKIDPSFVRSNGFPSGSVVPNSVVPNGVNPANVGIPGYPLSSPFVTYYVVANL